MKIDPTVVEDKLANQSVSWKFITERASQVTGRESAEKSKEPLKEPLRKVLGKAFLNYTEMMTVLTDIEAIINSRSLSYVSDDIRDGRIITPALLAIGRDLESPPDAPTRKAEVSLSERFRYQQRLQSYFWSRWLREYLPGLTVRQRWTKDELLEEYNDDVLDERCAPLRTAKVQEMQETRECQRDEMSPQMPKINDCSSLVGEDVETGEYWTL